MICPVWKSPNKSRHELVSVSVSSFPCSKKFLHRWSKEGACFAAPPDQSPGRQPAHVIGSSLLACVTDSTQLTRCQHGLHMTPVHCITPTASVARNKTSARSFSDGERRRRTDFPGSNGYTLLFSHNEFYATFNMFRCFSVFRMHRVKGKTLWLPKHYSKKTLGGVWRETFLTSIPDRSEWLVSRFCLFTSQEKAPQAGEPQRKSLSLPGIEVRLYGL